MSIKEDIKRFKEIGKQRREDLADFIQKGDLIGKSDDINIPIKVVNLPEFKYSKPDMGGVGQGKGGQPQPGQPVGKPKQGEGDGDEGDGEPGEDKGEHGYYNMDPEEFAEELERELELPEMEPKGKEVKEESIGAYKDRARSGPRSNLDRDYLFKKGIQRAIAGFYDEEYVKEALKVKGKDLDEIYEHVLVEKDYNIPFVKLKMLSDELEEKGFDNEYDSFEDLEEVYSEVSRFDIVHNAVNNVEVSPQDERFKHPEIEEEYVENAVIVNIRDCSGSMGEKKRDLVKRVFVPLDWYLQGKYENAEFIYIAHDFEAQQVGRDEFFSIKSGGGTQVSSAYELAQEILEEEFPWDTWNRYIFAGGDGENSSNDTKDRMVPLMEEIDVNYHAYAQVTPGGRGRYANLANDLEDHYSKDNLSVVRLQSREDVMDSIYSILSTEAGGE